MKTHTILLDFKRILSAIFLLFSTVFLAQTSANSHPKSQSDFWQHVHFGGGLGLNIGSDFTDVTLAPSAIYNLNSYVSLGVGMQGSYARVKNSYESYIYGGSLIGLFNPVEKIQISAELEQLRVNQSFTSSTLKDNFWNTALFLGAGYRTENITIGVRYNVLYNKNDFVYSDAFMPFIRIYF